jgi:hypothetical protein
MTSWNRDILSKLTVDQTSRNTLYLCISTEQDRVHKSPPLGLVLNKVNPANILTTYFHKSILILHFPLRLCSPQWLPPITSSPKYVLLIPHLSHASHMAHSFQLVNFILLPTTGEQQKLCMITVQQEILFNLPLLQFSAVLQHAQIYLSTKSHYSVTRNTITVRL